ncbi:MAG: hypothetical protein QNJ73_03220 [Gammaproteobacteria bacterium]|nr:hypothetical protein [Gammaproteobacteria bacterium]
MSRTIGCFCMAISVLLLTACGGGGGSSAPAVGGIQTLTATAPITSQNAPIITRSVLGAAAGSDGLADLGGLAGPAGGLTGTMTINNANVGANPNVVIGPQTENCLVSGTQTFTADIQDPLTMTSGDTLDFDFALCDNGDGVVMNGGFSMVVQSFSGDPFLGAFVMNVNVTASNLSATENGDTSTTDGDMNMIVDTMNTPSVSITISSSSLVMTDSTGTATLAGYSMSVAIDQLMGTAMFTVSGFLESPDFTGMVEFTTNVPLDLSGVGAPTGGEFVINGADGAVITVRIVSDQQIEIDVDLEGDGNIDDMIVTSWDQLLMM